MEGERDRDTFTFTACHVEVFCQSIPSGLAVHDEEPIRAENVLMQWRSVFFVIDVEH